MVLVIAFATIVILCGCKAIKPVSVTLFIDGNNCVLNDRLIYQIDNSTNTIVVPAGFVSDFASIPRVFYSIYRPTGRYQWAAVVHDYLYWEQTTSREEADNILLHAMQESGVSRVDRDVIYYAVRLGGNSAWDQNKSEKDRGLPRIIPREYMDIPANTTWEEYRKFLFDHGVRPTNENQQVNGKK